MKTISVISNEKPQNGGTTGKPKENNYMVLENQFLDTAKYLFFAQALLGINRLYLTPCSKTVKFLSYIYTLFLILASIYFLIKTANATSTFVYLTRNSVVIEYIILVTIALTTGRQMLRDQSQKVATFAENLNINNSTIVAASLKIIFVWLALCIFYNIAELYLIHATVGHNLAETIYIFIPMFTHDFEIILLILQIRNIYSRVLVMKAHVDKMFGVKKKGMKKLSEIEKCSLKVELDIKVLHKSYALINQCSREFNSYMNIPVRVLL